MDAVHFTGIVSSARLFCPTFVTDGKWKANEGRTNSYATAMEAAISLRKVIAMHMTPGGKPGKPWKHGL